MMSGSVEECIRSPLPTIDKYLPLGYKLEVKID